MHRLIFILFLIIFFASTSRVYTHPSTPDNPHRNYTTHKIVFDLDNDGVTDEYDCSENDDRVSQLKTDAYGDGIDSNCDGVDGIDSDGDGYPAELDCNEHNSSIYPGATEIPGNGIDEDGDGMDWAG